MFDRTDIASLELSLIHSGPIPSLHLPAVEAQVNFLKPQPGRPQIHVEPIGSFSRDDGGVRYAVELEPRTVEILDIRPIAEQLTLAENGFTLVRSSSAVADFTDEAEVRARFYPEVEALLKARTGASEVVIFDHTVRIEGGGATGARVPVRRAHGDYTPRSGPQRVRDLLPADRAADWLRGRFGIVNLWRPFGGPVEMAPLAIVDGGSLDPADLVPTDLVYRDRVGEVFSLTWSPGQRWLYVPDMTPEEALLIKTYDSDPDAPVRYVPHTAFDDPDTRPGAAPRRSIEVRALVRLDEGSSF
ncbi:CmcJ/NvfI family oxidoreductase [Marinibaculum pumilum]|uniref:CmcJ/NvfI family oxidoreductase n=1 Tax=Marinibaculum pumilum TaxID=1766165 RepID=A0ABV7L3S2_9PROT